MISTKFKPGDKVSFKQTYNTLQGKTIREWDLSGEVSHPQEKIVGDTTVEDWDKMYFVKTTIVFIRTDRDIYFIPEASVTLSTPNDDVSTINPSTGNPWSTELNPFTGRPWNKEAG